MADEDTEDTEKIEQVEGEDTFLRKVGHMAGVIIGAIGVLVVITFVIVGAAVVHGIVLQVMWGWFLVPLGLPDLGLAHAVGLGFLARYLTWQDIPPNKNDNKDKTDATIRRLMVALIYPFIILCLGAATHSFM